MTKKAIVDFLIHSTDAEKSEFADAVLNAVDYLKEVRTGTDFECECWAAANAFKKVLGLDQENEE
jgi:hypothetical protein